MKIIESLIYVNKWLKLTSGALMCLLVFLFIYSLNLEEVLIVKQTIIYLAIPGACTLIGLLEIISGVPFVEISNKWDSISGWQRGVLGIFIVVAFFLLFMLGVVAFAQ